MKSIGKNVLSYVSDIEHVDDIIKNGCEIEVRNNVERGWERYELEKIKQELKGKRIIFHSGVREIKISDDVEDLSVEAFAYLPELMKITFGSKIREVPTKCCVGCNLLEEIKFSKNTESIGPAAFCQVSEFRRSAFETLTSNPKEAKYFIYGNERELKNYSKCKSFNELVELPSSVRKLGKLAFGGEWCYDVIYSLYGMSFGNSMYKLQVSKKQLNEFEEAFEGIGRCLRVLDNEDNKERTVVKEKSLDTSEKIDELNLSKHDSKYDEWTRGLKSMYFAKIMCSELQGQKDKQSEKIDEDKKLYEESIILIGPSGAGKTTVAKELNKKTKMPRVSLDTIMNKLKQSGFSTLYDNVEEFNYYIISQILKKAKSNNLYGVIDFGAGHSVYDDKEIFEKIKTMLKPFKNIVLLLPNKDEEVSLEIINGRATGDISENRKFYESPCNKELATMTIYENGRQPSQVAEEIISRVNERKEQATLR